MCFHVGSSRRVQMSLSLETGGRFMTRTSAEFLLSLLLLLLGETSQHNTNHAQIGGDNQIFLRDV